MKTELKVIEHEIDWLTIINMALNKQKWGERYVLYKYKETTIICQMETFDFLRNKATFKITINYEYKKIAYTEPHYYNSTTIDYFLENFTIKDFKNLVTRRITRLLEEVKEYHTEEDAEEKYKKLKHYAWRINLEIEAEEVGLEKEYETIESLDNDELRESCLDEMKQKVCNLLNKEYNEKVEKHKENNKAKMPDIEELTKKLEENKENRK